MTDKLTAAIDALTNPTRLKVWRDGTNTPTWTNLPSLWTQLQDATGYRATQGSGSNSGHWPISGDVVDLIIDITTTVSEALHDHAGQHPRPNLPAKLRHLASIVTQQDDDAADWWADKVQIWVKRAKGALRQAPQRPRQLWGVPCPDCATRKVFIHRDGEDQADSALTAEWALPPGTDHDTYQPDSAWQLRAITCQACGATWWRGPDLDQLITQMLDNNTTRETLTEQGA